MAVRASAAAGWSVRILVPDFSGHVTSFLRRRHDAAVSWAAADARLRQAWLRAVYYVRTRDWAALRRRLGDSVRLMAAQAADLGRRYRPLVAEARSGWVRAACIGCRAATAPWPAPWPALWERLLARVRELRSRAGAWLDEAGPRFRQAASEAIAATFGLARERVTRCFAFYGDILHPASRPHLGPRLSRREFLRGARFED